MKAMASASKLNSVNKAAPVLVGELLLECSNYYRFVPVRSLDQLSLLIGFFHHHIIDSMKLYKAWKNQVGKIKFNVLDLRSISNWIFTAHVAWKNKFQN